MSTASRGLSRNQKKKGGKKSRKYSERRSKAEKGLPRGRNGMPEQKRTPCPDQPPAEEKARSRLTSAGEKGKKKVHVKRGSRERFKRGSA